MSGVARAIAAGARGLARRQQAAAYAAFASPVPIEQPFTPSMALNETKVTTLPNGLRVATETQPFARTATVGVWIDAGSRYETDATNGTAHFLEHMAFKGTASRSMQKLETEVENMGAHLNAYTSREMTTYYAKVMDKDVPAAVDILSDILQNSTFSEAAIERERAVILREMQEIEQSEEEVVFDHLHATAFQHSPLGRTILGSADNVRSITKADLVDYIATHYTAPRTVVAAAGAVDHDALVKLCESKFSGLSTSGPMPQELISAAPTTYTGSEVRIRDDDMAKVHAAVGFQGLGWSDPDSVALMVMQSMLGTWSKTASGGVHAGSELIQRLSANGMADSAMAFNTSYTDSGLFGVYAVASPAQLDDLGWTISHTLTKMVYNVEDDDVARARNQLKASMLLHLDGTSPAAEDIGRQLLTYGRRIPLPEMFARIDQVSADTIKRVADRVLYDKDPAIVVMGPKVNDFPDYSLFRRRTFWLRY